MLNLMKKTTTEKTAIQITPNQKATTTVANVAGKVKTGAFGIAPAEQNHVDPNAGKPADSASAAQTNQGDNAQQPKSKTGKQQPKDNGQGASNNGQNGNSNHAKAAK